MSEKENAVKLTVRGIALYPKKENGVQSYAIRINKERLNAINTIVSKTFGAMQLSYGTDEETGEPLLNVKTQYEVPVYDGTTGEPLKDVKVYHGADIAAAVTVKEWHYMKKNGVHAFLTGIVLFSNGEAPKTSSDYKSIMGNLI